MKAYTEQQKKEIINKYLNGESISSLSKSSNVARSTIYLWIDEYNNSSNLCKEMSLLDIHRLKQKCDRQEKMLEIIKLSGCSPNSTQTERYDAITALSDRYNVNTLCKALGMAKGSYYNHILRNKNSNTLAAQRNADLKDAIEKIYNDSHQIFGVGKIVALLRTQGYNTSTTTVGKIMHENGWFSIRRSAKTLYLQERQKKKNVLNQEFHATRPNEIWVSDVTYFQVNNKGYYICAIMDLYARKIVACE
ncbi:MAG: IS3 family transposase, partial [Clostridia bacterium]|nr:IS3 family transposase [Clostridia bacterium]